MAKTDIAISTKRLLQLFITITNCINMKRKPKQRNDQNTQTSQKIFHVLKNIPKVF